MKAGENMVKRRINTTKYQCLKNEDSSYEIPTPGQ